jgi:hypothetical protein
MVTGFRTLPIVRNSEFYKTTIIRILDDGHIPEILNAVTVGSFVFCTILFEADERAKSILPY